MSSDKNQLHVDLTMLQGKTALLSPTAGVVSQNFLIHAFARQSDLWQGLSSWQLQGGTATRPNHSTRCCNRHGATDDWRRESGQQSSGWENSPSASRPFLFSFVPVPCGLRQIHLPSQSSAERALQLHCLRPI